MLSPFLDVKGPLGYVGWFLSGICHQLAEHSLVYSGQQLPLCARCTGMYLGTLLGLALQAYWVPRASRLPRARVLVLMTLGGIAWVIDGVNSYAQFLTDTALFYAPTNVLRLATGMFMGLFISIIVYPMFNLTLWKAPRDLRAVRTWRDVAALVTTAAALTLVLLQHWDLLLYPLWISITVSVLMVLSIVNSMIVVIVMRRENTAGNWKQAATPLMVGLLLSLIEVGAIALTRHWAARLFPWLWSLAVTTV
jgi:uncharacterized membrane protein